MALPENSHAHPVNPQKGSVESSKPPLLFPPSEPSEEEWTALQSAAPGAVQFSGSAASGVGGPVLGKMNFGESNDYYIFRVALPGVAREAFQCDVTPDGQVSLQGFTTTGEKTVYRFGMKFEMLTQNLGPPGPFSFSFKLPGPVEARQLTGCFGTDGIFEAVLKKKK